MKYVAGYLLTAHYHLLCPCLIRVPLSFSVDMKLTQPEISWHETEPIYSCDFQPAEPGSSWTRLATAGRTSQVQLWRVALGDGPSEPPLPSGVPMSLLRVTLLSTLARHEKPINCVRWSPDGQLLASGSDDSLVLLWQRTDSVLSAEIQKGTLLEADGGDTSVNCELWTVMKCLRGHLEDVYDLCWSADSEALISGSVDSSSIQWRVKGSERLILRDHRQCVCLSHAFFICPFRTYLSRDGLNQACPTFHALWAAFLLTDTAGRSCQE